jgi:uncharacterized membrane protein
MKMVRIIKNSTEVFALNDSISDGITYIPTLFSNANDTLESFDVFQQKVFDLVDSAAIITNREMTVDENSLQINTTISLESKTTEYSFIWLNFSIVQGNELSFGDVFQVDNFFDRLYGEAALKLIYESNFNIKSVSPPPYERQDSVDTLKWSRTHDLVVNPVTVILTTNGQNANATNNGWQQNAIIIVVITVGTTLLLFVFYTFRRRKNNSVLNNSVTSSIVNDEDKIMKIIKSSGGSVRQSKITEQSGFSKAKISQLLAALEKSGAITRYKNGRDKIVTLKERGKSY